MKTSKIRNIVLGEGQTKIAVPIVGKTLEEVLISAENILKSDFDLVELRIDHFEDVENLEKLSNLLEELRKVLGDRAILSTFRTSAEGGVKELADEKYFEINKFIITNKLADAIDLEVFKNEEDVVTTTKLAKENGVAVIMSNHDFDKTPEQDEIVRRLKLMETLGADVCKIAVMPNTSDDVITLLSATNTANKEVNRPVITMSMGKLGLVSRLAGGVFGSTLSFGAVGKVSAPGQIESEKLRTFIDTLE